MAKGPVVVSIHVQMWKVRPCLYIIKALYWLGMIEEARACELAANAATNAIKISPAHRRWFR